MEDSTLIRVIVLINFCLLGLFAWPLSPTTEERLLDAVRRSGADQLLSGGLQLWAVGSTLVATVLLIRRAVKRSRGTERLQSTRKSLMVDAGLLLAWWLTLLGLCMYGFMLGMGG
jgi:hypothetical protein